MTDPLALLFAPLGEPGSGRVRYGAAMALYHSGALTEPQLEVYRIASAHDARDPALMLAERGLPIPAGAAPDGKGALAALVTAADHYLASLAGEGVAEVRMGMARGTGPIQARQVGTNSVVTAHLAAALAALAPAHPTLAMAIAAAAPFLNWITYDGYPRAEIGEGFATGHAYASIIGENAPIPAPDFDLGLFLIAPHVLYRDHRHAAPELYAPLTGPHGWRFGPGAPLVIKPAHAPVWNPPDRPHLTKVGQVPFLSIYGWTRDTDALAHVIPADDWPALEALRL
jgi:hypothetical protein